MSVCAVFPCQSTRDTMVVLISPAGCTGGKLTNWAVQQKVNQGMANAAGLHEGEPPLGYSIVIRCMSSTLVNPINEPPIPITGLPSGGRGIGVGSPTATLPLLISSPPSSRQHSTQPITREKLSMELQVLYPVIPQMTIGRLFEV